MKIFLSIFFLLFCFYNLAGAETFKSALKKAYENNSELNAERESINISKQELNVSKSAYLPTITVTGKKSEENTEKLNDIFSSTRKLRKEIIKAGQETDKPNFGRK